MSASLRCWHWRGILLSRLQQKLCFLIFSFCLISAMEILLHAEICYDTMTEVTEATALTVPPEANQNSSQRLYAAWCPFHSKTDGLCISSHVMVSSKINTCSKCMFLSLYFRSLRCIHLLLFKEPLLGVSGLLFWTNRKTWYSRCL